MIRLKPAHAVVGAWAAANLVLALVHLGFHPRSLPFFLYIGGTAVVAGFGLAVLLAVRAGRVGAQQRQPRRASAAVLAVIGVALGLAGFAYGWWLSALAFYPVALAAWVLRGERLPRGARPWPVALYMIITVIIPLISVYLADEPSPRLNESSDAGAMPHAGAQTPGPLASGVTPRRSS